MSTDAVTPNLRTISLSSISPNPDNPRKHHGFEEAGLKELAASIREHGIWEPIVVRPDPIKPTAFELIIGERRYRASKLAGKSDILAIVRQLSDRQALEVMILENLQREDLHPIEEGAGYQSLLDAGADGAQPPHTIDTLAQKIGKSPSYIYARLKLMQLIPCAREASLKNLITAGHAVLIARLQPPDQLKALHACFGDLYELKGIDPQTAKIKDICPAEDDCPLLPEKALREWIRDNVNLKLKGVPWDLADPNLVVEAGACDTCPKRSTSNPSLFAELTVKGEDTCFDGDCFRSKRAAFVKLQIKTAKEKTQDATHAATVTGETAPEPEELRQISESYAYTAPKPDQKVLKQGQWLEAKKNSCNSVENAIVVSGEHAGEFRTVCANGACKVHKHHLDSRSSTHPKSSDTGHYQRLKDNIAHRKLDYARMLLCRHMVHSVGAKLPEVIIRIAAARLFGYPEGADEQIMSVLLDIKKPQPKSYFVRLLNSEEGKELNRIFTAGVLSESLNSYDSDKKQREDLLSIAKQMDLKDAAKVLAAADKDIASARACRGCGCIETVACELGYEAGAPQYCHWVEQDLCSNPLCKSATQTPAKGVSKQKKGRPAGSARPGR
jgi:ParB/RepB/Spo0J family partition protein